MDPDVLTPKSETRSSVGGQGSFERAGFDVSLARKLAAQLDIDLHLAVELVASGVHPTWPRRSCL